MTEEAFEARFKKEWEKYKKERNERLHRFTVRALIIFTCLGLTTAVTVGYVAITADKNSDALCALRHDSERRVALGEQFLKDNPNGIPGISVDSLRRSTANAKQTVESLSNIDCPPVELEPLPTETP